MNVPDKLFEPYISMPLVLNIVLILLLFIKGAQHVLWILSFVISYCCLNLSPFVGDKNDINRQGAHGNNRIFLYLFPSFEIMDVSTMTFQN